MLYELRTYYCAPGRLPALNDRFEKITLDFWKKYGIKPVGFWTTLIGPHNQALTYMLQWESLAQREANIVRSMLHNNRNLHITIQRTPSLELVSGNPMP